MTAWDAVQLGWTHATIAAAWLLGFAAHAAIPLLACWMLYPPVARLVRAVSHRLRVWQLRRQTRLAGRAITMPRIRP